MEKTNQIEKNESKVENFNGFWIPRHNAKVMKRGLEENKAPFLPDASGNIKTEPIYNGATGYCLPAGRLIPVQFVKMENGYNSNIVFPRSTVNALGNSINENEKGVFYNFKDETGEFHTSSYFFPEQTQNPEGIINASKDKIYPMDNMKEVSMVIVSSEPKEYLGNYIAACRSGMKLSVDPDIAEEFKRKLMPTLENDIRDPEKRDMSKPSLSNLLFEADRRGTEVLRSLSSNNKTSPKKEKSKGDDYEMCF